MRKVLVILFLLAIQLTGCTVNFKSKELEFDAVPSLSKSFELESVTLLEVM